MRLEEGGAGDAWLIGDRGYALAPWLMTPLTNPQTHQEASYNQRHARNRSTIERTIGILKGCWMCLDTAEAALQAREGLQNYYGLLCVTQHRHEAWCSTSTSATTPVCAS
ncbi:hypothetical protein PFLUV_G00067400 [Perca fluviatilis]|uniref:DDE Tnp4 domain-containing protein n=1 Tax=Perca fluviatilis TaxID=8168 RepID=A0A6A5F2W7_PERFL|nr:hypothetical protein PFLUV_G00067400 [Perca fluviatilis]